MSSNLAFTLSKERLQAAMSCLDLSLDAELALYRRHYNQTLADLATPPLKETAEPYANQLDSNVPLSLEGVSSEVGYGSLDPRPRDPLSSGERNAVHSQYTPGPQNAIQQDSAQQDGVVANWSAESGVDLDQEQSKALIPFVQGSTDSPEEEETLPQPYSAEMTAEPKAFERFLDPSIEDYLESSEALLKHLEDSAASTDQQVKKLTRKSWVMTLRNIAIVLGVLGIIGALAMVFVQVFMPKSRKTEPAPQSSALSRPIANLTLNPSSREQSLTNQTLVHEPYEQT